MSKNTNRGQPRIKTGAHACLPDSLLHLTGLIAKRRGIIRCGRDEVAEFYWRRCFLAEL